MHGAVAKSFIDGYLIGLHPGVGKGTHDAVGHFRAVGLLLARIFHLEAAAEVEVGALIVGTEQTSHILHRHRLLRLHAQGELLHVGCETGVGSKLLHDVELTHAVVLWLIHIVALAVGFPEGEITFAVPETHLLGHVFNVVGIHIVFLVVEVDLADAAHVGRNGDMVIGDSHGSPDATLLAGTLALHLEDPHLFRVGDGEALPGVAVAILLDELSHQGDGLASCGAAFEHDSLQLLNHKHSVFIHHCVEAGVGGLADSKLLLVEAGIGRVEEAVGVACLRNLTRLLHAVEATGIFGVHSSAVDAHHRVSRIILGSHRLHPRAIFRIASVARHNGSVGRCLAAHHDARASVGRGLGRNCGGNHHHGCRCESS